MTTEAEAVRVRKLQSAIKTERDGARKRALRSKLRDLCAELARKDYHAKLANMGRMPA